MLCLVWFFIDVIQYTQSSLNIFYYILS